MGVGWGEHGPAQTCLELWDVVRLGRTDCRARCQSEGTPLGLGSSEAPVLHERSGLSQG